MTGAHTQIWEQCLRIFKDNLEVAVYNSWFKPIKPISFKNDTITLEVPSHFFYEFLEENYIDLLKNTLQRVIGPNAKLEYRVTVNSTAPKNIKKSTVTLPGNLTSNPENKPIDVRINSTPQNPFIIPGIKKVKIESNLDKNLTFENFVEGACNRLGINAGKKIAEDPGNTVFNPLFLHGPSGVGKTHLAQAIGLRAKELNSDKIILYVSSHYFQTQYTKAVKSHSVNDFINFYQNIDILIVDDVQDLSDKNGTQKVFFNIFNYIHQQKKQLILTADRPPAELTGFFDRLLSRFKWGLTAELEPPDFETRIEILKKKAKISGIEVSDKVIEILASSISTNVRELEGALLSVLAHSMANGTKITVELTKKVLKNIIKEKKPDFSIEQIIMIVGEYFKISSKAITAKTRKREVVQARQLAMYFAKEFTKMSLTSIGAAFGRDHTTVIHAIKTVKNLSDTDKTFKQYMQDIERSLKY
jgi:chromosomal replication initiator protein